MYGLSMAIITLASRSSRFTSSGDVQTSGSSTLAA